MIAIGIQWRTVASLPLYTCSLLTLLIPAVLTAESSTEPRPTLLAAEELILQTPHPELPMELRGLQALNQAIPHVSSVRLVPLGVYPVAGDVQEVRIREEVEGVPVFRGTHSVFFRADGEVFAIRKGISLRTDHRPQFEIAPEDAVALAEAHIAGTPPTNSGYERTGRSREWIRIESERHHAPVLAGQTVLVDGETSRSVWRVEISEPNDPSQFWLVLVDAVSGEILRTLELSRHVEARGLVYPKGIAGGPAEMRDFVGADLVLDIASPRGWMELDSSLGNNVIVWEDRAGDGTATEGLLAYATGDPLTFEFPFTGSPVDDIEAAIVNVFWAINDAHDRFYHLGFDEASGNFQFDNFGRGGAPGDFTRVFVQYQAGPNVDNVRNSNSAYTSTDGNYNSLTFGLWDRSGEIRDGAFDTALVYHEYVHNVVNRMVGADNSCDDGIQPRPLAEGWADYFAYSFTGDRLIGGWVSGNMDIGLRTQKIGDNFYGYANLCNILGDDSCNNDRNGEIWSATLYDIQQALIDAYGEEGRDHADRLIFEGMRYTPCTPTFLDARDGILAADLALTGGRDRCLIWNTVRFRGLGWSAFSNGPEDQDPIFALDVPPECTGGASLVWDRPRYGDDADAVLVIADANVDPFATARRIRVTGTSGDSETFDVSGSGMILSTEIPIRPAPATVDDGFVQVVDGDTLTAVCLDCTGAPDARVDISRTLDIRFNNYSITSESCHDDDAEANINDFRNEVPGILDAGERGNFNVDLGNAEPFPLEDVKVWVSSDHPAVHVVPHTAIPIGDVPAKTRVARNFRVDLRLLAEPAPAIQFGETATITFDVEARGFSASTQVELPLAADYADERGLLAWGDVETFEQNSPTAALWTHAPSAGLPGDQWGIQNCGDGGGNAMAYSGADCGLYDDGPTAATLVSPPLFDPALGLRSVHLTNFSWRNDVDLAYDPRSNYCDSEMVLMYFTDDPDRPRYDEPRRLRFDALQYWVEWPAFFDQRNTGGFATATPRSNLSNNTINAMDLDEIRLYWIFFTDVYDPTNSGGCRTDDPDAIATGYRLDNVRFEYDGVRLAAAADNSCAETCVAGAYMTMDPPDGGDCPGDIIHLSAEASSAVGCPGGEIEYRFSGPNYSTGYIDTPYAEVPADINANWTLTVRCKQDTSCSDNFSIRDRTLDDSPAGRLAEDSLRARKSGNGMTLSWEGTRAPEAYAIFGASVNRTNGNGWRTLLEGLSQNPPDPKWRIGDADAREYFDRNLPFGDRVHFYRVFSRIPCSGDPVIP